MYQFEKMPVVIDHIPHNEAVRTISFNGVAILLYNAGHLHEYNAEIEIPVLSKYLEKCLTQYRQAQIEQNTIHPVI